MTAALLFGVVVGAVAGVTGAAAQAAGWRVARWCNHRRLARRFSREFERSQRVLRVLPQPTFRLHADGSLEQLVELDDGEQRRGR